MSPDFLKKKGGVGMAKRFFSIVDIVFHITKIKVLYMVLIQLSSLMPIFQPLTSIQYLNTLTIIQHQLQLTYLIFNVAIEKILGQLSVQATLNG